MGVGGESEAVTATDGSVSNTAGTGEGGQARAEEAGQQACSGLK